MPFADREFRRLIAGYVLALSLVSIFHAWAWWWSHRRPPEEITPAVVPQMVEVELVPAEPSEAPAAPPAPAMRAKAEPKPRTPEPKQVAKPSPKKPETTPKKAETAPPKVKRSKPETSAETDDLAQRLKQLRESLGSDAPSRKERAAPSSDSSSARAAAKPPAGGGRPAAKPGTGQGAGKATTARADHLHNPRPAYPAVARARNWEGVSQLRVYVLPNGAAGQVLLARSSGHDVLDDAAVAAVRNWRFVPAKRGDQAIASWVQFPIVWKLK